MSSSPNSEAIKNAPKWKPPASEKQRSGKAKLDVECSDISDNEPVRGTPQKTNPQNLQNLQNQSELDFSPPVEEWSTPSELPGHLLPVPAFSYDLLPLPFRAFAQDAAELIACPPDYLGVMLIALAGMVIGNRQGIKPKQFAPWCVTPNLWALLIGDPGSGKSPAMGETIGLLEPLRIKASQEHEIAKRAFDAAAVKHEAKKNSINDSIKKLEKDRVDQTLNSPSSKRRSRNSVHDAIVSDTDYEESSSKLQAALESDDLQPPVEPKPRRYFTNDATMEKLHDLLGDNPGGLGVIRDELVSLLKRWERDEHANERGFVLQGWNGYGSYEVDRVGRGNVLARNICLSIIGGIQPDRLMPVIAQAVGKKQDDGLIQRFQLMVMPDLVPWENVDRLPNGKAKEAAEKVFEQLSQLQKDGAPEIYNDIVAVSRFDASAQVVFNDFLDDLRKHKVPNEESKVMAEHLIKFGGLMPSLALIVHLVECAHSSGHGSRFSVCTDCTIRALQWVEYLEAHARRVYGMATSPEALGTRLAEKIKNGHLANAFTVRDIAQKDWSGLSTSEACEGACTFLVKLGWLQRVEQMTTDRGGRPTIKYFINPALKKMYF